jgi:hypothetical protein
MAVAGVAYERGLAGEKEPKDLEKHVEALIYEPDYQSFV